jgi:hypothetical protein
MYLVKRFYIKVREVGLILLILLLSSVFCIVSLMNAVFSTRGSHFCFAAEVRYSPKFFKILKLNGKLSHHDDNGNVLNQTSMDIIPFITNLSDEI